MLTKRYHLGTHRVLADICVKAQSAAVLSSFKVTCTQSTEFVASL